MSIAKNDVALVTGAASGFGRALAERLVAEGGRVILVDINGEGATKLCASLNHGKENEVAVAFTVDTANVQEQMIAFQKGKEKFGRIDYVFANAGIAERPFLPPVFDPATAHARPIVPPDMLTLNIDLIGGLNTAALAFQYFERQDPHPEFNFRGKLVMTGSMFGIYASHVMPLYSTSKAGLVMFARSTAAFYKHKGITVNAVCPNLAPTAITPESLLKPGLERNLVSPLELVVDQMMSFLGPSEMTGTAIGLCKDKVWVHPPDTHMLEDNIAGADLVDEAIAKILGYKLDEIVPWQVAGAP